MYMQLDYFEKNVKELDQKSQDHTHPKRTLILE